jgi:RNA polymerase sigma-70 factor (ECF subfamily)
MAIQCALDDGVTDFTRQRLRLCNIAARILGDRSRAEDVVQEVWVRWQRTNRQEIDNPPAFLATATTRVALNVLGSAPHRRERTVTPWLEDMAGPGRGADDPADNIELTEATEEALEVLLQRLGPSERAAYLLRKAFDYPYARIGQLISCTATNARQLVRRAQVRLSSSRCQPVTAAARRRLVRAFVAASQMGQFAELETLLVADIRPGESGSR